VRRLAVVGVLFVVGCGRPDPASSPLAVGARAIVYGEGDEESVTANLGKFDAADPYAGFVSVRVGTAAVVIDDPGIDAREKPSGDRYVKVKLSEGQYSGELVTLHRKNLRSSP
jgi:hypothetical protein